MRRSDELQWADWQGSYRQCKKKLADNPLLYFQHTLALKLGRTRQELIATLDPDEWTDWLAYNELSPIGDERLDCLFALLATIQANSWRDSSKSPYKLTDFLIKWGQPENKDNSTELRAWMMKIQAQQMKRQKTK